MLSLWKATYWTTFILTWLFLPLLESYYTSGYYQGWERLRDAVNKNLKFQLVMFVVLIASVIYLWLEVGLLMAHVKQLAIALSHIYALIMALWLMGHGLVAIPRRFWLSSTSINNLNNVYLHLPRLVDNLEDSKLLLKEDCLKVMVLQRYYADEFIEYRDWILDLYNRIPPELTSQTLRFITLENSQINQSEITKDFMRKLRSLFNANLNSYVAYKSEYTKSIDEAIYWEDVTQGNGQVQFRNNRRLMISSRFTYIYFYYIRPWICRGYAVVLMALSVIMVESEILHSTKLSLVNFLLTKTTNSGVTQFLYCFLFFGFMIIAALDSLTQLKVFNMYHLVRSKSDVVSVCFYATYTARLTIPLSYNFLNLFVSRDSVFEDWYGKSVMLTGLFSILNNWLPRLIIIPLTLTMFNIYEKIKQRFGFSADLLLDDSEIEYSTDIEHGQATRNNLMIEAKRIVERELMRSESRDNRDNSNLLRPYSFTDAANINYERNRLEFHNSLSFTKDNNAKTAGGPVSERSISTLPLAQSTIKSEPPVSTLSPLSSSSQSTGSSQRSTRTTSKALRDHFDTNYKRDKGYTTNIHSIGNKYAFSKSQEQLNALADHITVNEQEDQPWIMTPSGFKFSIYGWPISRVTLIQTLPFCASAVTVPRQQTQS
ncbi:uncharacterized protein KQ657_002071 [Scheffersomyces spartinae]|uniref:LMBR1-like membrane protein n=1 Tax=Scheffersomyces spartinae TaxID=45513 RepID=A0A9P8AJQ8_9ASCO|nr:uncharacterized protein KQ657_002071 [Scheffersomyces spartinae]KAG7195690.1 hypothetical protein KQ657_002071 [Scheffersomyces spartinae]